MLFDVVLFFLGELRSLEGGEVLDKFLLGGTVAVDGALYYLVAVVTAEHLAGAIDETAKAVLLVKPEVAPILTETP